MLLVRLLEALGDDPVLDASSAATALLTTQAHITMRFDYYSRYPTFLWRLCEKWNPGGYISSIEDFLAAPDEELDVGFSLQLKTDAWRQGSMADAMCFLTSSAIQEELCGVLRHRQSLSNFNLEGPPATVVFPGASIQNFQYLWDSSSLCG